MNGGALAKAPACCTEQKINEHPRLSESTDRPAGKGPGDGRGGRHVTGPVGVLGATEEVGCTVIPLSLKCCSSGIYLVHLPQQMRPRGEQTLLSPAWPPSRQSVSHLFLWPACLCLAACSHGRVKLREKPPGLTAHLGPCSAPRHTPQLPGAAPTGSPDPTSKVPKPQQD